MYSVLRRGFVASTRRRVLCQTCACQLRYTSKASTENKSEFELSHYEILGVKKGANKKELKAAFLKLAQEHHPDANIDNPDSHDKFVELNEAFSTLSRDWSKREYDHWLAGARPDEENPNPHIYKRDPVTGKYWANAKTLEELRWNGYKGSKDYWDPKRRDPVERAKRATKHYKKWIHYVLLIPVMVGLIGYVKKQQTDRRAQQAPHPVHGKS